MRSPLVSAVLATTFSAFSLTACGGGEAGVPAGCTAGEPALRAALDAAPKRVLIDGTPLSECFSETIGGGDLSTVGATYIGVASDLATRARRAPGGEAALQLGYLVGAIRRGSEGSQGVTYELERRIEQEAAGLDKGNRSFARGLRAGRRSG